MSVTTVSFSDALEKTRGPVDSAIQSFNRVGADVKLGVIAAGLVAGAVVAVVTGNPALGGLLCLAAGGLGLRAFQVNENNRMAPTGPQRQP